MKNKIALIGILAGLAFTMSAPKVHAQAKNFNTLGGSYDTIQYGGGVLSMYCTNFNPAQEVQVQVEIGSVGKVCADSLYGIATIYGSDDGVTYTQLFQSLTLGGGSGKHTGGSDTLSLPNTTVSRSVLKITSGLNSGQFYSMTNGHTYIWTYNVNQTLAAVPRYWKLTYNNKLNGTANDSTFVAGTLYVIPK